MLAQELVRQDSYVSSPAVERELTWQVAGWPRGGQQKQRSRSSMTLPGWLLDELPHG